MNENFTEEQIWKIADAMEFALLKNLPNIFENIEMENEKENLENLIDNL